jgi:Ca-activated chloride channel family protein
MSIPILTEAQFNELAARGMAKKKTVDGVAVWQFEVPRGFKIDAPSNMDFTKEALRFVAGQLRPEDRFSLVAFAEDALQMVANTSGAEEEALIQAVDRLDQADLGDETYIARGMEMGYEQTLPGISPERVSRMVILTDGYTKDEHECYTWTRRAKKVGIVVSTMGLGLDFNEELLISLADVSGGHAYFADDPQEIPQAFRQELLSAQSIAWRDLSLGLSLPADVILRRAHRVRPAIASVETEADALPLGDLEGGPDVAFGSPAALLELIVPPRPAGTYRLAQITLRGRLTGSSAAQEIAAQDIVARYTEKPSLTKQTDPKLMSAIQKVSAFKLHAQAMEASRRGNVAGATRRLRTAGERLIEMGEEDLGHTMLTEAELMEKEGQMSAEGTKKLRYGTRKLA